MLDRKFTNIKLLRLTLKDATSDELTSLIEKIKIIKDEVKIKEQKEALSKKQDKLCLEQILSTLDKRNLTIDDLKLLLEKKNKKPRRTMAIRYSYTDLNGERRIWSGQGKTPVALRELMAKTNTCKEDYRIRDIPTKNPSSK